MSGLLELAERVEALSGPDRVVDTAIAKALGRAHAVFERAHSVLDEATGKWIAKDAYMAHEFTGSLDAAMTLVPEGLRLMLSEWDDEKHLRARGPWQAVLSEPGADASFDLMRGHRCDHAATAPLALVSAALRARASC